MSVWNPKANVPVRVRRAVDVGERYSGRVGRVTELRDPSRQDRPVVVRMGYSGQELSFGLAELEDATEAELAEEASPQTSPSRPVTLGDLEAAVAPIVKGLAELKAMLEKGAKHE
jgi:hypothetical protein